MYYKIYDNHSIQIFIYLVVLVDFNMEEKILVAKSIENLDDLVWRKFVAYCKVKDVLVGHELTRILAKEVEGNGP